MVVRLCYYTLMIINNILLHMYIIYIYILLICKQRIKCPRFYNFAVY